jgi:hypothetical protein
MTDTVTTTENDLSRVFPDTYRNAAEQAFRVEQDRQDANTHERACEPDIRTGRVPGGQR